ncbi:MAG: hypothetical protein H6672_07880 [Anaerolineaceae bacterium]|nr:hypothetical protein [Anaerolineaceae bacterium]
MIKRFWQVLFIFTLAGLIIPLSSVAATQLVIVDFAKYPDFTPVDALSEPHLTFSSTGSLAYTGGGYLFLDTVGTIEISLDVPATDVWFSYFYYGVCSGTGSVELFLGSVLVDSQIRPGCSTQGYSQTATFDRLVISTGSTGINRLLITGYMVFTFPDAAVIPSSPDVQFEPGDERINHAIEDRAAPVAIYCEAHGIQVRRIDPATGIGIDPPAINLFYDDIEVAGIPTERNLLLTENEGVALYRLTTGEFQVNILNANPYEYKWYVFVWDQCPVPTVWYHLAN